MRVCPKCGFEDAECWRNHRWQIYVQYCHIEELEVLDPELAEKIREAGPTEKMPLNVGVFVYVLKKTGYVWRIAKKDYDLIGFSRSLTESPRYAERLELSKSQTRLEVDYA